MLSHLAYVSVRKNNCTEDEIKKILAACEKNNPPLDITGVLLYSDSRFIQYVEGEAVKLTALYDKIKNDARHERVVMISYSPIPNKIFPSWHMGAKKIESKSVDFLTDITQEEKATFNKILNNEQEPGDKVRSMLARFFK